MAGTAGRSQPRARRADRDLEGTTASSRRFEQGFIQPVLGWKINYQTFLRGRRPDYALFLTDDALDAALAAGRQTPEFWHHPVMVADAKAVAKGGASCPGERKAPPEAVADPVGRRRPLRRVSEGVGCNLIPSEARRPLFLANRCGVFRSRRVGRLRP